MNECTEKMPAQPGAETDRARAEAEIVMLLREVHDKYQALFVARGANVPNDVYMAMMYTRGALMNRAHSLILQ